MDLSAKALPLQKLILRVQQSTKLAQICASYNGVRTHCNEACNIALGQVEHSE